MVCYVNGAGCVKEKRVIYFVVSLVAGKRLARGWRGGMWRTWWGGMNGAKQRAERGREGKNEREKN